MSSYVDPSPRRPVGKRNSRVRDEESDLSSSIDHQDKKRVVNKKTPRFDEEVKTDSNKNEGSKSAELTSYQKAFLSKYGNVPSSQPSGGINWTQTAPGSAAAKASSSSKTADRKNGVPTEVKKAPRKRKKSTRGKQTSNTG